MLNTRIWKEYHIGDIFEMKAGFYSKKPNPTSDGVKNIPFASATKYNNGISEWYSLDDIEEARKSDDSPKNSPLRDKIFKGNCLIVANDGSVGETHYIDIDFAGNAAITALYIKGRDMNPYIGMFLCAVFENEKYRFSYGRKWKLERMGKSTIWLPVSEDGSGEPDWQFMEDYIKTRKYSNMLEGV